MEDPVTGRFAIVFLVACGIATPALADRYYVVRDVGSQECSIVRHLPEDSDAIVLGEASYGNRKQAEDAAHASRDCKSVPIQGKLPAMALH